MRRIYARSGRPPADRPERERAAATGTGWLAPGRLVVTAHHVVDGAARIVLVLPDGSRVAGRLVTADRTNDLAILSFEGTGSQLRALPLGRSTEVGESVFTLGYPLPGLMGSEAKLTEGTVSSLSGVGGDPRLLQISVPVQAGNSGGPLLNMRGEVVGVVLAKLSAAKVFGLTGDLTENVNYAVKIGHLKALLDSVQPTGTIAETPRTPASLSDLASRVRWAVVLVEARSQ